MPTLPPEQVSSSATDSSSGSRPPQIPGYEILDELGRGGMGVVYKACQVKAIRIVALKMILGGGHADDAQLERFRTEAEAVARLQHPNIVQVFEVGEHEGLPFFSLEFCDGGSLEKKLAGTPLPANEAAALEAAHRSNVIHRDLKPANILLAPASGRDSSPPSRPEAGANWVPKITDFGLAKKVDEMGKTQTGAVMGTPSYMAPEQANELIAARPVGWPERVVRWARRRQVVARSWQTRTFPNSFTQGLALQGCLSHHLTPHRMRPIPRFFLRRQAHV